MSHLGDTNKMVGEDHIRDATKMVSDTPRTDAKRGFHDLDTAVDAEFSEQLEFELNAANERIKRLEEFVEQLTNPKFTRDDLPKEALLQRIKRLEEFANRFLNPDDLGWAIGKHDRDEAREALGKERVESK